MFGLLLLVRLRSITAKGRGVVVMGYSLSSIILVEIYNKKRGGLFIDEYIGISNWRL
jgi:hypothetical protein